MAKKKPARKAKRKPARKARPVPRKEPASSLPIAPNMVLGIIAVLVIAALVIMFAVNVPQDGWMPDTAASEKRAMLDRCQSECEGYGYLVGECVKPTEARMPALEIWECDEGTKCFCQDMKEPVTPAPPAEPEVTEPEVTETNTTEPETNATETGVPEEDCNGMALSEAMGIAEASECIQNGTLTDITTCNYITSTWWIEMDVEDMPQCNPACVVSVDDRNATINWRCMGLIMP